MASVSPPKPWERAAAGAGTALPTSAPSTSTMTSTPTAAPAAATITGSSPSTSTNSTTPSLPSRPDTLNAVVNRTASTYSPYGANRFGASPYSTYGGYGAYSSPYSRFGSMYGGMGGYGGMYGGMGGMYPGMPGDPNDPNSLTNSFSQSTAATFQMIESIVGAFGGFAQMLESTYMATHSSFFAMVSVAEQFGNLRNTLGSVLGIFTLIRWFRTLMAKLTGRPLPADATALTPSAFSAFLNGRSAPATLPDGGPAPARPSRKPFFMFILAVFGLPYLMGKLIRSLARSQEEEARRQQAVMGANGELQNAPLDPSKLDFCRVLYDYTPDAQNTAGIDLAVKKGDIVAVISKSDPMGNPSEWWRCRARDGGVGYLPSPYLETIQRRPAQAAITAGPAASAPGSRTSTMTKGDSGLAQDTKPVLSAMGGN
uniref:Peroxisomal membrane protein PEX13 n=1 Tax=Talaromyces marneffei PM1 TaxID=1077442 RepID=A0A093UYQ3_TALMA